MHFKKRQQVCVGVPTKKIILDAVVVGGGHVGGRTLCVDYSCDDGSPCLARALLELCLFVSVAGMLVPSIVPRVTLLLLKIPHHGRNQRAHTHTQKDLVWCERERQHEMLFFTH